VKDSPFYAQVELLLRVLPLVAKEDAFALKGGTAINLFIRNMPRLSVDIDLTFLPLLDRDTTFSQIGAGLTRIKQRIEGAFRDVQADLVTFGRFSAPTSMSVHSPSARIRIEVNVVVRGAVYPIVVLPLCQRAQDAFEVFSEVQTLSLADLYGGKLCAALDRQHPRDLFDVKLLLSNEGITEEIRKAFLVYLISHSRPMNELLAPRWQDLDASFNREFRGMTPEDVTVDELKEVRETMLLALQQALTRDERAFLVSLKRGEPIWDLLGMPNVAPLPAVQWKLANIQTMAIAKRALELEKLQRVLGLS
jgi:predicted nucleotidyltransferase component of viral defense system